MARPAGGCGCARICYERSAIANLIMNLVRFCGPDTVVLGGGVVSGDFFCQKELKRLDAYTVRYVAGGVRSIAAELTKDMVMSC